MEAREAVKQAKLYLADLLQDEQPSNIGLEEIEKEGAIWRVTLGFSRPWNQATLFSPPGGKPTGRSFRMLTIDDKTGEVLSMKKHEEVGL